MARRVLDQHLLICLKMNQLTSFPRSTLLVVASPEAHWLSEHVTHLFQRSCVVVCGLFRRLLLSHMMLYSVFFPF